MRTIFTILCSVLIFIAGCAGPNNKPPELTWYSTSDQAIEHGLQDEGIDRSSILAATDVNEETLVFFENNQAFGVASIAESPEGYAWYRSSAYTGFQGDSPYMTGGFEVTTYKGQDIQILAGEAFDRSITKMIVKGDGAARELPIQGSGRFFFTMYQAPFDRLEFVPVK